MHTGELSLLELLRLPRRMLHQAEQQLRAAQRAREWQVALRRLLEVVDELVALRRRAARSRRDGRRGWGTSRVGACGRDGRVPRAAGADMRGGGSRTLSGSQRSSEPPGWLQPMRSYMRSSTLATFFDWKISCCTV